MIEFSNGMYLQLSQEEQAFMYPNTTSYQFTIGTEVYINIHRLFWDEGITLPSDLYLVDINFLQQILPDESQNNYETIQAMEIDYFRIIHGFYGWKD